MNNIRAELNYLRVSPRKARLLADLVRGMSLSEAKAQMKFNTKKASSSFLKLLKSAEQNARHNFHLEPDDLYIKEIRVDGGPVLKRYRARARGRAALIRRRSSHIKIVLAEKPSEKSNKSLPRSKHRGLPRSKHRGLPRSKHRGLSRSKHRD